MKLLLDIVKHSMRNWASQVAQFVKNLLLMQETQKTGSISGSGRSSGEENGNPLQYSCLEKSPGRRSLEDYSP